MIEANHLHRSREPLGNGRRRQVVGLFQSVFLDQVEVVPLIEDLAAHFRVEPAQHPDFGILLRDQLLAHGRYLDEQLIVGKKEVRREMLVGSPVSIPADGKSPRLVKPGNSVEVQK
jgi:hypothetical protein